MTHVRVADLDAASGQPFRGWAKEAEPGADASTGADTSTATFATASFRSVRERSDDVIILPDKDQAAASVHSHRPPVDADSTMQFHAAPTSHDGVPGTTLRPIEESAEDPRRAFRGSSQAGQGAAAPSAARVSPNASASSARLQPDSSFAGSVAEEQLRRAAVRRALRGRGALPLPESETAASRVPVSPATRWARIRAYLDSTASAADLEMEEEPLIRPRSPRAGVRPVSPQAHAPSPATTRGADAPEQTFAVDAVVDAQGHAVDLGSAPETPAPETLPPETSTPEPPSGIAVDGASLRQDASPSIASVAPTLVPAGTEDSGGLATDATPSVGGHLEQQVATTPGATASPEQERPATTAAPRTWSAAGSRGVTGAVRAARVAGAWTVTRSFALRLEFAGGLLACLGFVLPYRAGTGIGATSDGAAWLRAVVAIALVSAMWWLPRRAEVGRRRAQLALIVVTGLTVGVVRLFGPLSGFEVGYFLMTVGLGLGLVGAVRGLLDELGVAFVDASSPRSARDGSLGPDTSGKPDAGAGDPGTGA